MREIRTELEVDAPPEVVWDVLTDLSAYPEWNPHVTAASGDLRERSDLDIEVRPGGSRSRSMNVTVTALEPQRKLEWVGTVVSPWLFEGRHTFELEPLADDRTRVVNRERLGGVLVRFVVADDAECDYEAMNLALAERAENRYAAETPSEP